MQRNHVALVKDPVHGSIDLTLLEKSLLGHHLVDRLQNVKQLALVYRVFPGATHTRLIHSLGTMHVAWQIFKYALANSLEEDRASYLDSLRKRVKGFINYAANMESGFLEPLADEWSLHVAVSHPFGARTLPTETSSARKAHKDGLLKAFSKLNESLDTHECEEFSKIFTDSVLGAYFVRPHFSSYLNCDLPFLLTVQALRLKALLHDVGHLPYSHVLEFALARSVSTEAGNRTLASRALHEKIGATIEVSLLTDSIIKIPMYRNHRAASLVIALIGLVMDFDKIFPELYKSLISAHGSIDADRIDYVLRDGLFTGMLQSSGDYERVYKTFVIKKVEVEDEELQKVLSDPEYRSQLPLYMEEKTANTRRGEYAFLVLPTVHGLNDVSQILVDRYRLAKNVNNHHRVRRLDGLLQEIVEILIEGLKEKRGEGEERKKDEISHLKDKLGPDNVHVQTVEKIVRDFSDKKQLVTELAHAFEEGHERENFRTALRTGIERSLEFSEFTDDWVTSKLRELHTALSSIAHSYTGDPPIPIDFQSKDVFLLYKLLAFLEEFLSRRSFVSLWKREADFVDLLRGLCKDSKDKDEDGGENSTFCSDNFCKIWVTVRSLINVDPNAWRILVNYLEKSLQNVLGHPTVILLARNTGKHSVSKRKPLFLTELSSANRITWLLRGEHLQPTLHGILRSSLLDAPFYAYIRPKDADEKLDKGQAAKMILKEVLNFFDEYTEKWLDKNKESGEDKKKRLKREMEECKKEIDYELRGLGFHLGSRT